MITARNEFSVLGTRTCLSVLRMMPNSMVGKYMQRVKHTCSHVCVEGAHLSAENFFQLVQ